MLASKPEIGDILRQDVQEALEMTGGEMTNGTVQNMKRLDSFLKEVSRWYPLMAGKSPKTVPTETSLDVLTVLKVPSSARPPTPLSSPTVSSFPRTPRSRFPGLA
jgi:hypothetical protein